jgi:hypothetical protein
VLLLFPAALRATPARYTPLGRKVARHQIDFAICGATAAIIPAVAYLILGLGP